MAKRNISKMDNTYDLKITSEGPGKVKLKLIGINTNGTSMEVTVIMGDYFLKHMVSQSHQVAVDKYKTAVRVLNDVREAIKSE